MARSDFFDLLEFPNSWHAPRLRLVNGRWLLIGVHEGIDITAERGTPILSMTPGRVENVGWTFYGGTRVGVRGTDGRYYFYAHLSAVAPGIVPGRRVAAGTSLGRVGNTGYGADPEHRDEFPPHLHFGIELPNDGLWVNPYPDPRVPLFRYSASRSGGPSGDRPARKVGRSGGVGASGDPPAHECGALVKGIRGGGTKFCRIEARCRTGASSWRGARFGKWVITSHM